MACRRYQGHERETPLGTGTKPARYSLPIDPRPARRSRSMLGGMECRACHQVQRSGRDAVAVAVAFQNGSGTPPIVAAVASLDHAANMAQAGECCCAEPPGSRQPLRQRRIHALRHRRTEPPRPSARTAERHQREGGRCCSARSRRCPAPVAEDRDRASRQGPSRPESVASRTGRCVPNGYAGHRRTPDTSYWSVGLASPRRAAPGRPDRTSATSMSEKLCAVSVLKPKAVTLCDTAHLQDRGRAHRCRRTASPQSRRPRTGSAAAARASRAARTGTQTQQQMTRTCLSMVDVSGRAQVTPAS